MQDLTKETLENLEKTIQEHMYYHDIPGLAAGIVKGKNLVYEKGFGFAHLGDRIPMTPDRVFHMASISKLFTATAVMQLHERKLVDIEEPILRYLPDFRPQDPRFSRVTIRQMLSHTSGIPDCEDYEWEKAREDEEALHEYVMAQQGIQLLYEPGERFFYSNIAFEMLGELVRVKSGMSFEDYCRQQILTPMEMKQSDFRKFRMPAEALVAPHVKNEENHVEVSQLFPYNRSHGPSSTLYSTIGELSQFARGIMDTHAGLRRDVLLPETLRVMMKPQAVIKKDEQIGLGWFISDYDNEVFFGHEGNDIGFRTTFAMIPEKEMAIMVMANLQKASTRKIMRLIYDMVKA